VDDLQPPVGHVHDAHVGLDRAERIVGALRPAAVMALKIVLLPTLGRPTIPQARLMGWS
jgi:hypothetical protein